VDINNVWANYIADYLCLLCIILWNSII